MGERSVKFTPTVDPDKVILPPLDIKLILMKHFVKVLERR
jgi:hypothetical protein